MQNVSLHKNLLGVSTDRRTLGKGVLTETSSKKEVVMLRLTRLSGGHVMFSEDARNRTNFPSDGKVEEIVRSVCPNAETETPRRYPTSLIVKLPPDATEVHRALLLDRMEDKASRMQFC